MVVKSFAMPAPGREPDQISFDFVIIMSLHLYIHLSFLPTFHSSVCRYIVGCPSVRLFICLALCLYLNLSLYLLAYQLKCCKFTWVSFYIHLFLPFKYLHACFSVHLSVRLSSDTVNWMPVCLFICLGIGLSVSSIRLDHIRKCMSKI